jgi:hypothetical protein
MGKDEETEIVNQGLTSDIYKQMKLNCGAQRHHYSMFSVGRSMFDVHLSKQSLTA